MTDTLTLLQMPDHGTGFHSEVTLATPDGVYWKNLEKDPRYPDIEAASIIVIGPMKFCPLDYEIALRHLTGKSYKLYAAEFLPGPPDSKEACRIALCRGVVSLRFAFHPNSISEIPRDLAEVS